MYKNIIFDLGGVIVEWKPKDFLTNLFMDADIEKRVYNITFGSEEWKQLDKGTVTRAIANEKMLANAKKAGCLFEVQEVIQNWVVILQKRRRVYNLALLLQKAGYRIYYLSNIASDTFSYLQDKQMLPSFDGGVASFEVSCNKPEPQIYQVLLQKYELLAEECIFIDDTKENVQAACNLGFTGIVIKNSVNALVRNLRACGITLRK
ncbi:MAG: HAD family phosphatase [Faecalibacterium sp.]